MLLFLNIMDGLSLVKDFLWDNVLVFALLGGGIFLSIALRFPQFHYLFPSLKKMVRDIAKKKPAEAGSMTPFQSLATAVAAQVGTGNIIGVASAIAAGGPGAAFWMLLSAFFGMATIFSEAVLAQVHREEINKEKVGGPAYYIKNGLGSKAFASLFAVLCIIGLGIVGVMVQANSIVSSLHSAFNLPSQWLSLGLSVVVGVILAGGMGRIAKFSENVVPVMAGIYIFASLAIVVMNIQMLGPALKSILVGAFKPEALAGGTLGISIREASRYGLARGLFSNEAGMGSTPHSHAVSDNAHPAEQGFMAMIGVFIATFIICLSTVIVNLTSGAYDPSLPAEQMKLSADLMTQNSFSLSFGNFGASLLSIALTCFALTTIIGWYFFAESNVKFLFGESKLGVRIFRVLSLTCLIVGALYIDADTVWTLADLFMGLMALPNIVALFLMWRQSRFILEDYASCLQQGQISWDPARLKAFMRKS